MKNSKFAWGILTAIILPGVGAHASLTLDVNGAASQNFDGGVLPTTSTTLTATVGAQNALGTSGFVGTKLSGTGTTLSIVPDTGAGTSGNLYSYGASGSTDRALGTLASGTTVTGFGVEIVNPVSGTTISNLVITFNAEQWRSSTTTTNRNAFAYTIGAGGSTTFLTDATLTLNTTFDLVAQPFVTTNGVTDGNTLRNSVNALLDLSATPIAPGQSIYFRWSDVNDAGNDAGIALDDFTVTAVTVPEPTTVLGGVMLLGVAAVSQRRRLRGFIPA